MIFSVLYIDYILFLAAFYFLWRILNRPSLSLPPGPRGYPIIGNVLDMPQSKPWEMFGQWGDRWVRDINSVTVFGKPFIILNSYRTAYALLDKRSLIYSDRPKLVMAGQMMGWGEIIGLLPYGEEFRSHRKMFHSLFGSKATIRRFYPMEELEAKNFMRRLFDTPHNRVAHIRQEVAALVLRITYGYEVLHEGDEMVKLVNNAMEELSVASTPGAFLVDFIPMLKSLPDWFPGAGFKRTAKMWAKDLEDMINVPFEHVKAEMARGQALDSFVSGILQQGDSVSEHDLKWTAGAIYAAGGDTTVAALDAFFLLMVLNPEVQKKAQEELDLVLGGDRLPTYNDMDDLPYITALCKEVVRFHPVAPIGIPHFTTEDDIFEGHYIPKGSMVISNIWKMTHDPNVYKNPMQFDPTRFMGENPEQDPREVSFGFGRRVCPGRLLAQSTIFIVCAMALSLFDIRKVKGEEPTFSIEHGSVSHPTPYNCTFTPRSSRAVELLQSA
ncbi:cytochrome P450 [Hymenopellis radicata]|nr:cytochrome P450 [Hymenopellis radicata]